MSQNGRRATLLPHPGAVVVVGVFDMAAGDRFDWHEHGSHQLAWSARGVLTARTAAGTWMLPPSTSLWIPAGMRHTMGAGAPAMARSLYFRPDACPIRWTSPTVVPVGTLLASLIGYLCDSGLADGARAHAERVVLDLIEPATASTITAPVPAEPRIRAIAEALHRDPSDARGLRQWGRQVGAAERTLARLFHDHTGMSFGQWRTQLRIQAALPMLADGTPVSSVARRVGYQTPSAFVAAFRRVVGSTPGAYLGRAAR